MLQFVGSVGMAHPGVAVGRSEVCVDPGVPGGLMDAHRAGRLQCPCVTGCIPTLCAGSGCSSLRDEGASGA